MQAFIVSIGDELTTGQRLDTNSQWLSQQLGDLGVRTLGHLTVADDLAENVAGFRQACERADVVIATGGLGPTADDLTREVLAQLAGVELELDEHSLEHIKALFSRRARRPMPERNIVQAMFPRGGRPIANPEGTAPGVQIAIRTSPEHVSHVFALPGVPWEMQLMWEQSVVPALVELGAGGQVIRHRRIKCFGAGESDIEQRLPDLIRRGRTPLVGITVHEATITLRVTAAAATEAECFAQMEPTLATIRECLGSLVFGAEDDELEHAVLRTLGQRGQALATCEQGLGGSLATWLTTAAEELGEPAATAFRGGLLHGPSGSSTVSRDAVAQAAEAARTQFAADFGLAALVAPGETKDSPPRLLIALARAGRVDKAEHPFIGQSAILKPRGAKQALDFLRHKLDG